MSEGAPDGHLEPHHIQSLRRLADSAPQLVKLAEHADDIILSAKDREWWRGTKRRLKVVLGWLVGILGATVSAFLLLDRMRPPGGK